jgi:hypothetical protein
VATRLLREKTDIGSLRARLEDPNSDISELG